MARRYQGAFLDGEVGYKKGDPAPAEYLRWHAWADAQYKAGLRQSSCSRCGKWHFPQELDAARYAAGVAVCTDCAAQGTEETR